MAKNKTITQFTELAEKVKSKNEPPQPMQTIISTDELEDLKEKSKQPVPSSKKRIKGVHSFTLSNSVIAELDRLRAEQPILPSRSEMLEYIVKEYLKLK
jgi:hypothetical protein